MPVFIIKLLKLLNKNLYKTTWARLLTDTNCA